MAALPHTHLLSMGDQETMGISHHQILNCSLPQSSTWGPLSLVLAEYEGSFVGIVTLYLVALMLTSEYESALRVELPVKLLNVPFSKPRVPTFLQVSFCGCGH